MLQALIGPVANLVGGFLNNRHEQAQAKHQANATGNTRPMMPIGKANMAAASASSWKDEFWTLGIGGSTLLSWLQCYC